EKRDKAMIRRGFWLTAGAVTGIWGYRRVAAAGRRVSASLTPGGTLKLADTRAGTGIASRRARRGAVALARETYRFTRDVRAGMQPFKPYLLGQRTPPYKRAADVQKCVRTLDIEEVGKTTRHATFFQMLGNWSFGDYFKEGAIRYAWELLTKSEADGGFGFPESKLWATVLHGDDEAYAIWRNEIGLPAERIQHRGLSDNYWHMGVPGPGGPWPGLYYDRGPE